MKWVPSCQPTGAAENVFQQPTVEDTEGQLDPIGYVPLPFYGGWEGDDEVFQNSSESDSGFESF